jgi:outer membrane murein-binding lipoprotein Lpp
VTENLRTKNRMAIAGALFAASILAGCSRTESAGKEELTSQTPSNPMEIRTKESLEER